MTIEKCQKLLMGLLIRRPELVIRQLWYSGELPYSFAIFLKGDDNNEISLGRVKLAASEIVRFNNSPDEALRDLLRPKIERVIDEAGVPLLH